MEIFTFDKSLQERFVEYNEIFCAEARSVNQEILPASRISSEWSIYIELIIEPVGWQALWKISRSTCQDLEIHYPTIVLVEVEHIDCEELSALVKIIAVQDEIHLPAKYDVPVIELYPTKNQENHILDVVTTANCIDQLRFFYNYLWMPWDDDNDENTDWVTSHLEQRLRLFFDMKKGEIPKKTCEIIRALVREGKDIKDKISKLEPDVSDDEDQKAQLDQEKTCQLMKYHFRLQQIKTEMEVLENPAMRTILVKNHEAQTVVDDMRNNDKGAGFFVWLGGSLDETIASLNKARTFLNPDVYMQTTNNLQEALDNSRTGDVVVLGNGNYDIRGASGLEDGGTIKGIGIPEQTILCPAEIECGPSLLDFSGGEVLIENVSINLGERSAGIIVRQGCMELFNCKLFVKNQSVVKLGIIVMPGAKLFVNNITFQGLGSAVVIHRDGEVVMNDCKFEECVEGVHIHDDSKFIATNCNFCNFKESAIRLETDKYVNSSEGKSGGVEVLQNISEVMIQDCNFENNLKQDIVLRPYATTAFVNKMWCV